MSYEVISVSPLVNIKEDMEGIIEITHRGKPVKNVFLTIIKILNNGNVPILKSDFDECIKITFPDESNILWTAPLILDGLS